MIIESRVMEMEDQLFMIQFKVKDIEKEIEKPLEEGDGGDDDSDDESDLLGDNPEKLAESRGVGKNKYDDGKDKDKRGDARIRLELLNKALNKDITLLREPYSDWRRRKWKG
jgi:hypothetical protein